ncbi:hypothetical protein BpHYR1_024794 [Brachionus plicatilis]|uniref:Uncharacterized protein n=1 Tax=Brachionus plicatilis TaxID=10195 RepID=A0A3M7PWQ6_BRAPC|nr:hypothetical protein BpHYR1_024794 [Brachionus plicatilis]
MVNSRYFTICNEKYSNLKNDRLYFLEFFPFKLFAALSQVSLNVDPFKMNLTFISFLRPNAYNIFK